MIHSSDRETGSNSHLTHPEHPKNPSKCPLSAQKPTKNVQDYTRSVTLTREVLLVEEREESVSGYRPLQVRKGPDERECPSGLGSRMSDALPPRDGREMSRNHPESEEGKKLIQNDI